MPVTPPANVLVLGEMDVPAAIVERHVGGAGRGRRDRRGCDGGCDDDLDDGESDDELDDVDGEADETEEGLDELDDEGVDEDDDPAPVVSLTVITSEVEPRGLAGGRGRWRELTVVEELVVVDGARGRTPRSATTRGRADDDGPGPEDAAAESDAVTAEVPVVEAGSPGARGRRRRSITSVDDLFARLRASSSRGRRP